MYNGKGVKSNIRNIRIIIHIRIKVEHFQESGKKKKKNWLENF